LIQRNTPELFVRDVDEAVRFYTETLGFRLEGRMPEEESKPTEWAMVMNGNASFMFQRPDTPKQPDGVVFYLAVEDADAAIAELRARGAVVEGPVDQFYGYREATVIDPTGYKLVFTAPVPAAQPAGA
jgi:predicted enzyme related to lactoylglutathione lyase